MGAHALQLEEDRDYASVRDAGTDVLENARVKVMVKASSLDPFRSLQVASQRVAVGCSEDQVDIHDWVCETCHKCPDLRAHGGFRSPSLFRQVRQ